MDNSRCMDNSHGSKTINNNSKLSHSSNINIIPNSNKETL